MTLWPEIEKVFGHGYEVRLLANLVTLKIKKSLRQSISLAVSNSKHLIATACKATTAEHAVVRVYDTDKWQLVGQPLEGHSLTITRIAFSPDDKFILSVSRDRTWRLFENQGSHGE
jgi:elongator complex protein 2